MTAVSVATCAVLAVRPLTHRVSERRDRVAFDVAEKLRAGRTVDEDVRLAVASAAEGPEVTPTARSDEALVCRPTQHGGAWGLFPRLPAFTGVAGMLLAIL